MNKDIINSIIREVENNAKEKDIDINSVANFLIDSIKRVYTRKTQADNLEVVLNIDTKEFYLNKLLTVVDDSENYDDFTQILVSDPEIKNLNLNIGDVYRQPYSLENFTRAEVLIILQTYKQRIMELVNNKIFHSWKPLINKVVIGEVEKQDHKSQGYCINLNDTPNTIKTIAFMPKKESNINEHLANGRHYPFVVKNVIEKSSFWPVLLSRTADQLLEYYMNEQIPEIEQELIKITSYARIANYKSKILVKSISNAVPEPVVVCIGKKGTKIKEISKLLGGEKIEIYKDYNDVILNLVNIIGKENMYGYIPTYDEDNVLKSIIVYVKNEAIQLLLGKNGNNIKLINKLLHIHIDVEQMDALEDNTNFIDISTVVFEDTDSNEYNDNNIDDLSISNINDELLNDLDDIELDTSLIDDDLLNEINNNGKDKI